MNERWIRALGPVLWVAVGAWSAGCDDEDPVAAVDLGGGGIGGGTGGAGAAGGPPRGGNDGTCDEGETFCDNFDEYLCENGEYIVTGSDACVPDVCEGENCEDGCAAAARRRAYLGCEFWPVDLDNAVEIGRQVPADGNCPPGFEVQMREDVCIDGGATAWLCDANFECPDGSPCVQAAVCVQDAQQSPFAVVVSNPSESDPVTVTFENMRGNMHQTVVQPGGVATLKPSELGWPDGSVNHTSINPLAYKLTSDRPIVAYQFNPLDNVGVFSNDGSLLIPAHAYDTVYYAMTQPTLERSPLHDFHGYISIVAITPGVQVRITPRVNVKGGFATPDYPAGEPIIADINMGDVFNLEAVGNGDLTGTLIESTDGRTPIGVFVGHEAVSLTDLQPNVCCGDHIEEQLFPASSWGLRFALARSAPRVELRRGIEVPDLIRVMALEPDTGIRFDPPARDREGRDRPVCRVGTGEWCDFFIDVDTVVLSDKPILVGHFLTSAGSGGAESPVGDPAMAFAPPFEQFRDDYTFLVPEEYAENYISVVAAEAVSVQLDGTGIDAQLAPFPAGTFKGGRIEVQPGQHRLTCPGGCGLLVHGYSPAVSYMFAGGLDLQRIAVP